MLGAARLPTLLDLGRKSNWSLRIRLTRGGGGVIQAPAGPQVPPPGCVCLCLEDSPPVWPSAREGPHAQWRFSPATRALACSRMVAQSPVSQSQPQRRISHSPGGCKSKIRCLYCLVLVRAPFLCVLTWQRASKSDLCPEPQLHDLMTSQRPHLLTPSLEGDAFVGGLIPSSAPGL